MSGQVRPRQGTEICNFGAPSPLETLHWIFCFLSSIFVQFSKTSPLKSGESSEKSSGENRVKSCHVCGCHGFFGPDHGFFFICLIKLGTSEAWLTPRWVIPLCNRRSLGNCDVFCEKHGRNRAIPSSTETQASKRHININFLVRLLLGRPRECPGTNRVCPWDKPTLPQGQTQVFFLSYTVRSLCALFAR